MGTVLGALGVRIMLVTWSLFLMWIIFNVLDTAISWMAAQYGASEIGLLYLSGSWWSLTINKMLLALLIGGLLVYIKKNSWLALLTVGMLGLCLYNGVVLLRQMGG